VRFRCQVEPRGDTLVARLRGELDLAGAQLFEETIEQLATAGAGRVILDLRELEFLDSSGLRLIMRLHKQLGQASAELLLVRGPNSVQRIFALTRVDQVLDFVDGIDGHAH
jgi:anti-sigma B factor antagonist